MPYATSDDMVARFGEAQLLLLADRDNDGVIDSDVVDQVLADATSLVDLHVRGRYAVPLSPAPAEITTIVCDLARRGLYGNATEIPESVLQAAKEALALLKLIAAGTVVLDVAPAAPGDPGASTLAVETGGPERQYTMDKLSGF